MTALLLVVLSAFAAVQAIQLWRGWLPAYGGWPEELLRSVPVVVVVGIGFFGVDLARGLVDGPEGVRYALGTALLVLLFVVGGAGLVLIASVYVSGRPQWLVPPVLRHGHRPRTASSPARDAAVAGTALPNGAKVRHPALLLDGALRVIVAIAGFAVIIWAVVPAGPFRWGALAVMVAGILWGVGMEAATYLRVDPDGLFVRDPLKTRLIPWREVADVRDDVEGEGGARNRRTAIVLASKEQVFAHALQAPGLVRGGFGDAPARRVADLRATIAARRR